MSLEPNAAAMAAADDMLLLRQDQDKELLMDAILGNGGIRYASVACSAVCSRLAARTACGNKGVHTGVLQLHVAATKMSCKS